MLVCSGIVVSLLRKVIPSSVRIPAFITIIASFVTLVMITGGIDIQAPSIIGLTSIIIGVLWSDAGMNIWVSVIIAVIVYLSAFSLLIKTMLASRKKKKEQGASAPAETVPAEPAAAEESDQPVLSDNEEVTAE